MEYGQEKEAANLVYIEKVGEEDPITTAMRVLNMYYSEFNLSIKDICAILKCDRQWVIKHVKDKVKHIFLNNQYRKYLCKVNSQINQEILKLSDYYYFSKNDFASWLKNNTVATRQTIRFDVNIFCNDLVAYTRITEEYISKKNNIDFLSLGILNQEYNSNIYGLLSDQGQKYFLKKVNVTKRNAEHVELNEFTIPKCFTSIKELKEKSNKSLEIAYRELYDRGATKYTIDNSLVRYDKDYALNGTYEEKSEVCHMITVPYKLFKKI